MTQLFTGYIEGYYGRLLEWQDRDRLLDGLEAAGMTSYFYAPKDDACQRQFWRQTHDAAWRRAFTRFAGKAATKDIQIIAGISPGLDFDYASLDQANDAGGDFTILLNKALMLLADGASFIALLMDDIAADFERRAGSFASEGTAHAVLTNRLGAAIDVPIILVPRIYADSLVTSDDSQSKTYLKDLARDLEPHHRVVYCGDDIVAVQPRNDKDGCLNPSAVIIWDNFYANDYCPRRLFLGPWRAVKLPDVMLNPTGMLETDLLLLDLMSLLKNKGQKNEDYLRPEHLASWRKAISKRGVPEAFFVISYYLDAPSGFPVNFVRPSSDDALAALEILLWRWKAPLQREWYGCLMGLKQDILLSEGRLSSERLEKTQLQPLVSRVNSLKVNS